MAGKESDVICVSHMGHCDKNGSKFHLAVRGRAAGEVENNTLNCVTLSLVNGHGESQVKGEDVRNLSSGNRGENVASGMGEFGVVIFCRGGQQHLTGMTMSPGEEQWRMFGVC